MTDVVGPSSGPYGWYWNGIPMDVIAVLVMSVGIALARVVLERLLYRPVAYMRRGYLLQSDVDKFLESCYRCTHFAIAWIWGLSILLQHNWHLDTKRLWVNFPHGMSAGEFFYLLYQLAFYVYSFFATTFVDARRKDWTLLITHHLVTVLLMAYAWIWGFVRVSIVILVCLDTGVVFLEFAKCSRYLRLDGYAYLFFTLLVIFWIVFRLYFFWAVPIRSALTEGMQLIRSQGVHLPWYVELAFYAMLLLIYALQIYWFYLILRVLLLVLTEPAEKVKDVREA